MVHHSAETGFAQQSEVYARARPGYHSTLVARVCDRYGNGTVADLGAGTGIFTGQLIAAGLRPIAIEPVDAMRATIEANHPGLTIMNGTAEETGLAPSSVATVVAAQAFHWFNHPKALAEIRRVLAPGGHLVCVWNVRDEGVRWVKQWTEIVDRYAGDTPRYRDLNWRRAIDDDAALNLVEEWSIPNPVPATPDSVVARSLSTSFIAALDAVTQRKVLLDIRALAEAVGSEFEVPYRSELQAWQMA